MNSPLYLINCTLLSTVLGIYIAQYITCSWANLLLLTFIVGLWCLSKLISKKVRQLLAFILIFLFSFAHHQYSLEFPPCHSLVGKDTIYGQIISTPSQTKIDNAYLWRAQFAILKNSWHKPAGKCYLYWKTTVPHSFPCGSYLLVRGKASPLNTFKNTGTFSPTFSLYIKKLTGKFFAQTIELQPHQSSLSLSLWAEKARQYFRHNLQTVVSPDDTAVLFALLFGGYDGINPELLQEFSTIGLIHILSVSGSHIALFIYIFHTIGQKLSLSTPFLFTCFVLFILFYLFLAEFSAPIIRAALTGVLTYLAQIVKRQNNAPYLLSLICWLFLLANSHYLFDVSFQLSFSATAGLIYFLSPLQRFLKLYLPNFLALSLVATISAQVLALPFMAWYFQALSPISLLSNLLLVPPLELIISLLLCGFFLQYISLPLAKILFIGLSLIWGVVQELSHLLATIPGASLSISPFSSGELGAYLIFLATLLFPAFRPKLLSLYNKKKTVILLIFLFYISFSIYYRPLEIHFIDVGQGDSALIITPKRQAILIDTGGLIKSNLDIGEKVLLPYLKHQNIHRLEAVFLSHSHYDHIGGCKALFKKFSPRYIFIGPEPPELYRQAWHMTAEDFIKLPLIPLQIGDKFTLNGVNIETLHLGQFIPGDANTASLVLRLSYQGFSALFTGDIPDKEEQKLLKNYPHIPCHILKVAHHGSKTSSSSAFLNATRPVFSIISSGTGNRYHHPSLETLQRLTPSTIYRTDQHGAIVCRIFANRYHISTYCPQRCDIWSWSKNYLRWHKLTSII